jgi:hypothetical protein
VLLSIVTLCHRCYADNWTLGDICDMDVFE